MTVFDDNGVADAAADDNEIMLLLTKIMHRNTTDQFPRFQWHTVLT